MSEQCMSGKPLHLSPQCPYCDGYHAPERCPRLKGIEYREDGTIRKVAFIEYWEELRPRCRCCGQVIGCH